MNIGELKHRIRFEQNQKISDGQGGFDSNWVELDKLESYRDWETDRKSTRLNSSHSGESRMPSSA